MQKSMTYYLNVNFVNLKRMVVQREQELIWNETLAINMYYKNSGKEQNLILPLASITVFLTETNLINVIV